MSDNFIKLAKCEHCCGTGQPNGVMGGPNLGLCSYCGGSGHVPAPVPSDIPAGEAGDLIVWLNKASKAIYLATDGPVADEISPKLLEAAARLAAIQQERDEAIAKLSRNEKAMDIIERASKLFLPDVEATESSLAAEKQRATWLAHDRDEWKNKALRQPNASREQVYLDRAEALEQRVAALVGALKAAELGMNYALMTMDLPVSGPQKRAWACLVEARDDLAAISKAPQS